MSEKSVKKNRKKDIVIWKNMVFQEKSCELQKFVRA